MKTLLDTVEPDAWEGTWLDPYGSRHVYVTRSPSVVQHAIGTQWENLYSHLKVESLLAECRKQTLLEAAEDFATRGILYGYTVADQLNHKAEGEK